MFRRTRRVIIRHNVLYSGDEFKGLCVKKKGDISPVTKSVYNQSKWDLKSTHQSRGNR